MAIRMSYETLLTKTTDELSQLEVEQDKEVLEQERLRDVVDMEINRRLRAISVLRTKNYTLKDSRVKAVENVRQAKNYKDDIKRAYWKVKG